MSSRLLSALAFTLTLGLSVLLAPDSNAQQIRHDDPAAAAGVLGIDWVIQPPVIQPAPVTKPTPVSPSVVDCPLPLSGHVLQPSTSGIYASLGPDQTVFDLSIQGFDLFVSVREADGLWYRGYGEIGSGSQRYVVPLRAPGSNETVRYLTLCTTSAGNQCKSLRFAITSLDPDNPSPTGSFIVQSTAWRSHNSVICVKRMS